MSDADLRIAAGWRSGLRLLVKRGDAPVWRESLCIAAASRASLQAVGLPPRPRLGRWWVLTSDGNCAPINLLALPVTGTISLRDSGTVIRATRTGSDGAALTEPRELFASLPSDSVMAKTLATVEAEESKLAPAAAPAAAQAVVPAPTAPAAPLPGAAGPPLGDGGGAPTAAPIGGGGAGPAPAPAFTVVSSVGVPRVSEFRVIAPASHPLYNTVVLAGDQLAGVRMGDFILAELAGVVAVIADGPAVTPRPAGAADVVDRGLPGDWEPKGADQGGDGDQDLDARVLAIRRDGSDQRFRGFRDTAGELSESPWDGWPILGPRTVRWCCRFIAEQNGNPRARHTKWRQECGLKLGDEGVREHELAMRTLEMATTFDQLNVSEISAFELLMRSAQLAELRHKQTLIDRRGDLSHGDDEHLYLGLGETRGLVMIAPDLETYVATEMSKEASVLKERRKLREERDFVRPKAKDKPRPPGRRDDAAGTNPTKDPKGKGKGKPGDAAPAGGGHDQ